MSTVSHSLLINSVLTPRFNVKKGLRQGDPMSSYLFVLVIEYLNRSLKQLKLNPNISYHPKCSKMEIVHICFVDDLLICCRANYISIKLVMDFFTQFSDASRLKSNMEKSSLCLAGVFTQFKKQIRTQHHFTLGTLSFRYLGVPQSTRKLTISEYLTLKERIVVGVKSWTSRFLSYAGRIQLIKSDLFEMQTY